MEERNRRRFKFNVVDGIVLLIIIVGVILLAVKLTGDRRGASTPAARIEYTVLVRAVHPEVCENIMGYKRANAQLMAGGNLLDGYVTDITSTPHVVYEGEKEQGALVGVETGENARMDMVFTIQAGVEDTVAYRIGTQEVRIGKSHIVKTTDFELEGYSTTILSRETIQ